MKLSKWLAILAACALTAAAMGCTVAGNTSSPDSIASEQSSPESESNGEHSVPSTDSSPAGDNSSNKDSTPSGDSSHEDSTPSGDSTSESTSTDSTANSTSSDDENPWEDDDTPDFESVFSLEADNRYAALDIENKISTKVGRMSFITKESYRGIKRIAFNAKTGDTASWWGIAITDDPESANVYNTDLASRTITNDYWTSFIYDFEGTGCTIYTVQGELQPRVIGELSTVPYSAESAYSIYFVGPRGEYFSQLICIDNFTIELLDGTVYTETFDEDVDGGLFHADRAVSHIVASPEEEPTDKEIPETLLQETNAVYYTSDERIDFTAYAPVTVANWAGPSSSNPNLVTDEQYRYMAEAGFTKSLALYEGRSGGSGYTSNEKAEKDALAALECAEKYGIQYYVLNERFYNFVRPSINLEFFNLVQRNDGYYNAAGELVSANDAYKYLKTNWMELYEQKMSAMFDENTQYIDSPAYGGNFASDEPALPVLEDGEWYYGELKQLYYQLWLYKKYMRTNSEYGGEAYVNLNPCTTISPANREAYNAMLDYYFEKIAPLLGYVSYDHYPLNFSGSAYIGSMHLTNLEIMANYCKEYDTELRAFLWAKTKNGYGHRAIYEANDLRFQAYANLAFGVKEMPYYTYFNTFAPGEDACDSLIDCQTGERTKAYYWAKQVNNEIHALEQAYLNFRWEGSMYLDVGRECTQFSLLETSMTSHKRLTRIDGNTDVLVGVFSDQDGQNGATDGFVVMNYTDPYYFTKGDAKNVVLTFDNATQALIYKDGKQYIANLTGGELSLYLEAGEGMFVVPLS